MNQVRQKSSMFNRKYVAPERRKLEVEDPAAFDRAALRNTHTERDELSSRLLNEVKEIRRIHKLNRLDEITGTCYYRLLLQAIEKHKTYRAIEKEVGIPRSSIHNSIKKLREILSD